MSYVVQDIQLRKGLTDYTRGDAIEFTPEEIAQGLPETLLNQGSIGEVVEPSGLEEMAEELQEKEAK